MCQVKDLSKNAQLGHDFAVRNLEFKTWILFQESTKSDFFRSALFDI